MLAGAIGIGIVAASLPAWSDAAAVVAAVDAAPVQAGAPPVAAGAPAGTTTPADPLASAPGSNAATPADPLASAPGSNAATPADPLASAPGSDAATPADPLATGAGAQTPADPLAPATRHGRDPMAPEDPLRGFNRFSYRVSQPIDKFIFRPIAMAYYHFVPPPVRDGARNFLDNLFMSQVLANDILQLRPKRALHTTLRFLINTTLGIGGIFDIAKRKPFHLPGHPNSLGDTFGYYGVRPGPYIYLPIVGPSTLRDLFGAAGDAFTQPLVLNAFSNSDTYETRGRHRVRVRENGAFELTSYGVAAFVVGGLDKRSRADDELKALKEQSVDPYAALRSAFLQNRAGEISALKAKGNGIPGDAGAMAGVPAFDDPLDDPAAAPAVPAPATPAAPATPPSAAPDTH